jgi:hypothetical protein
MRAKSIQATPLPATLKATKTASNSISISVACLLSTLDAFHPNSLIESHSKSLPREPCSLLNLQAIMPTKPPLELLVEHSKLSHYPLLPVSGIIQKLHGSPAEMNVFPDNINRV